MVARPTVLSDGIIDLILERDIPADGRPWSPSSDFRICLHATGERVGGISLRTGNSRFLRMYAGHIGYGVLPGHRGHRYAARACRLLRPLAVARGMDVLWITCNPDNIASRRTCEIVGARYVETVDVPPDTELYQRGETRKCRYRWELQSERNRHE